MSVEEFETKSAVLSTTRVWPVDGKEMILIPAGEFVMGDTQAHWDDQKPAHRIYVAAFYLDRYPVTNAEYRRFLEATGHPPPKHMPRGQVPPGRGDHPVINLAWNDAQAYARWAGKRLPSEAEWEKAASWDPATQTKRRYPWGEAWDPAGGNTLAGAGPGETLPVWAHSPRGDSAYGVADLIGNVWEWCSSSGEPYPYRPDDGREDLLAERWRVLRGAAWDVVLKRDAGCTFRYVFPSHFFLPTFGCRCATAVDAATRVTSRMDLHALATS